MKYINKYSVSAVSVILSLMILGYTVDIFPDKIEVGLPSTVCGEALLRVTKDDFTLKCGRRIAFQADTIVEYYKTYGPDEWVRNFRYVGRAKKDIELELFEYEDSFDIVRTTRYRKGRQYVQDGILREIYTFTQDKVKITYEYEVNNKAKHRISMRIKKQYNSYLDASDPFGNTAVLQGNILSYEGYGNLLIDPTITLHTPSDTSSDYVEGDSVPFICSCNQSNDTTLRNTTLWWNAVNESIWEANGTVSITGNATTTFTRTIPHPVTTTYPGTFKWNCECGNTTATTHTWASANSTLDARYIPEVPTIDSPDDFDINLLNGSGPDWNLQVNYPGLGNFTSPSANQSIWINWTHPGLRDNSTGVVWNLSYVGTLNTTRKYTDFFNYDPLLNTTTHAEWNVSNLEVDAYFITLTACNALNTTLCSTTTTTNAVDIFDYGVNITTGETKIRFSPQPTFTKGPALGQTSSKGIVRVGWLGSSFPDGQINLSVNLTAADKCMTIFANDEDDSSTALELINQSYVTGINASGSDPDYIWLYATKSACGTTTLGFSMDLDLFFGGPR